MAMSIREAAGRHVERFNAAVRGGDWAAFAVLFAPAAVMRFTNIPAGPFVGRDEIARGYDAQPPDDTMTVVSVAADGDGAVVEFRWDHGGPGTMRLRWDENDLVAELVITFG